MGSGTYALTSDSCDELKLPDREINNRVADRNPFWERDRGSARTTAITRQRSGGGSSGGGGGSSAARRSSGASSKGFGMRMHASSGSGGGSVCEPVSESSASVPGRLSVDSVDVSVGAEPSAPPAAPAEEPSVEVLLEPSSR